MDEGLDVGVKWIELANDIKSGCLSEVVKILGSQDYCRLDG